MTPVGSGTPKFGSLRELILTVHFIVTIDFAPRGGGVVLPITDYKGRLRPKGVPFFRLEVCERVGISRVQVWERVGKTAI